MWVKVEEDFYNTDHILSVERKEDAGVYYSIRFADGKETGFNEEQIKPLLDALEKMAGQPDAKASEDKSKIPPDSGSNEIHDNSKPVAYS